MLTKFKTQSEYLPTWVEKAQSDFGFWSGSLTVDTDPTSETKTEETKPDTTAETKTETPETPTTEVKPDSSLNDVLAALREVTKALKPTETKTPDTTAEAKTEETKTLETDPRDLQLETMQTVLREMIIDSYQVPDFLVDMLPSDPIEVKNFLKSEKYKTLKDKLDLVSKPLNTENKTEETKTDSKPDPDRKDPQKSKPKTFDEIDSSYLADLLKDV